MNPGGGELATQSGTGIVVAQQIAQATTIQAPLPVALRAAAAEADSRRLRNVLSQIAAAVEKGQSLDDALQAAVPKTSKRTRSLLQAAQRTGNLPGVVSEWIDNRRRAQAHWREVTTALAYPTILAALAFLVFLALCWGVVPAVKELIVGFELKTQFITRAIFWCSEYGAPLACAIVAVSALLMLALRLLGGRELWSRFVSSLPLIGDLWHWSGVAEMLRGLRLLLEHRIPLPEALRSTGDSVSDAYVGRTCRRLGRQIEQGNTLVGAIDAVGNLPQSILPLLRAGEQQGNLPEALEMAAQALEARLRLQSSLIATLGPPAIFVLLAAMIGGMYMGLYSPLVTLIQGLT